MKESMGQIIRRLRKERNLTQEELAEQLNITFQAVSRWENETGLPDISQVVPLANVLGVTADVLFGMQNTNDEAEIDSFIDEMEKKIYFPPEGEDYLEHHRKCCDEVQEKLKTYPNNPKLLEYSLGNLICLIDLYYHLLPPYKKEEKIKTLLNECIRQSNLILKYSDNAEYRRYASGWMVKVYETLDKYDKAEEYASNLPQFDIFNDKLYRLGYLYSLSGRNNEAIPFHSVAIRNALDYLSTHLKQIGDCYRGLGKFEEAYACHRFIPDLYDYMTGEREDEFPIYVNTHYIYCARDCVGWGRYDEALDWLERYARCEFLYEKNYRRITKSTLPYLAGAEINYKEETRSAGEHILYCLRWKWFDPIRENPRFKALVKAAEESIEIK